MRGFLGAHLRFTTTNADLFEVLHFTTNMIVESSQLSKGMFLNLVISRLQLCNSHFEVKHIFRFGCLIFWFVGYVVHCWRGESDENVEYWRISFCETKTLPMNCTKPRYKTHNAKSEDDELRWIRFTKWCEVTQKNESLEVESIWEQIICSHSEINAIFEWKTK